MTPQKLSNNITQNNTLTALCISAAAFLLGLLAADQGFGVGEGARLNRNFVVEYLGLNGSSHVVEGLCDIGVRLGTDLKKGDPELVGHGLAFLIGDLPVGIWYIALVPYQDLHYVLAGVHFDLFEPVFHVMEGIDITDRVGHNDPHRPLIVGLRDSLESFLPSSVPYLQPYFFVVDFDCFDLEVDAWVR